ncbi:uncharacterized protein O3C94_022768 isoform 1-T1 [Discoglossus pictus]
MSKMRSSAVIALIILLLHSGESLKCYTCLFPTIAPMDCVKFPVTCPPSQSCLISTATGRKGNFQFVLHERSCAITSLCGTSGERTTLGINVTFQNTCCNTDLCNSGIAARATVGMSLLPPLLLLLKP